MNIMSFVRDKVTYITALLLSDMAVGVFLYLIDVKGIFILFLMILWNVSFFIVFFMEYWQKQKYYRHVNELITMLDKKTLLADLLKEEASFLDGQILESVIAVTDKYMNDLTSEYERSAKEYREYVEMWVHEIKTPLTVANLLIDSHKDEVTKKIGTQLQQVDNFVEQALFYARSTSLEKDFLVKQVTLKELVTEAVKQNAKTLIGARMSVELDEAQLDYEVYADPKWMTFILGQIITNAVKYRSQEHSAIHFTGNSYAEGIRLIIRDNGIGIEEKDISRIFEKGFTGENGRNAQKSTGIGLYLCKKLCNKMNLHITADSTYGTGTTLTIAFPVNSMTKEIEIE